MYRLRKPVLAAAWRLARLRGETGGCAWANCEWPGRERHESLLPADDGMWNYRFCSRRHLNAWYQQFMESNFGI